MNRIDSLFTAFGKEGRRALMPFLTAGDPDLATTEALIREVLKRGGDLVEIGIPYSDPIADGPVVSASYTRALTKGVKLAAIFEMVRSLRGAGVTAPLVTMVSYAIVLRHGPEAYANEAKSAGIDGLIVPDLPVEEAAGLLEIVRAHDLRLIQLVTPTTPADRVARIARAASGFIYYVSIQGITGERRELPADLAARIAALRSRTALPICIGFGISLPDHVRQLAPIADGLIVGSAIVRRIAELEGRPQAEIVAAVGNFVSELAKALNR